MEPEIKKQLDEQAVKIDAIYKSVEKTRKYFLVIIWITVILFVLPLIASLFMVPFILGSYASMMSNLGI